MISALSVHKEEREDSLVQLCCVKQNLLCSYLRQNVSQIVPVFAKEPWRETCAMFSLGPEAG
jgi:hypothetical protein